MSKQKNKSDFKAKSMELLLKSTIHSNNRENTGNFSSLKLKNAAKSPAIQHQPESQPPHRRPLGFVCHAFISPWGRNECVTNEPQRTSAGRLLKSRSFTLQRLLRELQCYMIANLHGSSEKYVTFKKRTVLCVPSPVGWPRMPQAFPKLNCNFCNFFTHGALRSS